MEKNTGYRTITYRFRLMCERQDWFLETKKIYNRVLKFYYDIVKQEQGLTGLNKQKVMRQLEIMSIGTKADDVPKYPIPFEKVPLYFRRAAINDAVRLYRSYDAGRTQGRNPAEEFHTSPVYYKGMYKDFTETSICLKLFDGERWNWITCGVDTCGRTFPEQENMLSPTLKIDGKRAMLHVPVKQEVSDIRPVAERLNQQENICAVAFPSNDCLAVLVVLSPAGEFLESCFIRGGKELAHRRKQLQQRIEQNRKRTGIGQEKREVLTVEAKELPSDENKTLKEKMHHITDDAAHKISREIVDFCKARSIGILVVPNYKQTLNLNRIGYVSATNYDWLGRRIISYLKYKSFGEGIITATASTKDIASKCYLCGEKVKKYNKDFRPGTNYYGGKNFVCPNGHKGNSYFNSAMNVGRNFLKSREQNPVLHRSEAEQSASL